MRTCYKPDQKIPFAGGKKKKLKKGFCHGFAGFHFSLDQFPSVVHETLVEPMLSAGGSHHAFPELGHLLSATLSSGLLNS